MPPLKDQHDVFVVNVIQKLFYLGALNMVS